MKNNASAGGSPDPYRFAVSDCEVVDKDSLHRFRKKRSEWLDHLSGSEPHSIQNVLSSMAWIDVAYRTVGNIADHDAGSGLHNPLIFQMMVEGYFAVQVLAVRRLLDRTRGTISLWRLVDDLRRHRRLFTRENFVAFDGLPYDYETARARTVPAVRAGKAWADREGHDAWIPSFAAHEVFDKLAGTKPSERQRGDQIPARIFDRIAQWCDDGDADQILDWCNNFLAHTGSRLKLAQFDGVNVDKITTIIRSFIRASEAIAHLLHAGSRGNVVPVAQYNQFSYMDAPVCAVPMSDLMEHWHRLADERDKFVAGTIEALIAQ